MAKQDFCEGTGRPIENSSKKFIRFVAAQAFKNLINFLSNGATNQRNYPHVSS